MGQGRRSQHRAKQEHSPGALKGCKGTDDKEKKRMEEEQLSPEKG